MSFMRAVGSMPDVDSASAVRAVPWTLWGHDPIVLHDRLWLARGVQIVRPGAGLQINLNARRYLAVPERHHLVLALPEHRSTRGTRRVRSIAPSRKTYHEYLEFDDDRAVRSIRRQYGPNGSARPDCVFTADQQIAEQLSANFGALDRLNGSVPHVSQQPGVVLFDAREPDECARWLGSVVEQGEDFAAVVTGVRRLGVSAWGPETIEVPGSARLAGPVFLGRGVVLPEGSVVVGPAVLPDGWTHEDHPVRGQDASAREDARAARSSRPVYEVSKRVFDVIAASVLLVAFAPLMAGIAVAIRMQDGAPILFRQARQTHGGRNFECLKFRTMIRNADEMQEQLREQNQVDGPQFSMKHDPRILPIGRWLRKTQLDELPQLWNVIRGEMSLVGPRPSPEYENQCCPPWREARLSVPAGITGLWQVRRRREPDTDFQEWIRYDIEYAGRRGWWLDVCVLVETAWLFVPYRAKIGGAMRRAIRRTAGRRTRGTRPI